MFGGPTVGASGSIDLFALDGSNGFRLDGVNDEDYAGYSVSAAGDLNGDSFDDIVIGAPGDQHETNQNGLTYVVFGGADIGAGTGTFTFATDVGSELTDLTGEDDEQEQVELSFAFPFLGTTYSTLFVSTNGYVNLGADAFLGFSPDEPELLGSSAPVIAPFWSDVDLSSMGEVLVEDSGSSALITWNAVGSNENELAPFTFQLELRADGSITFSYDGISNIIKNLGTNLVVGFTEGDGAANPGETDFSAASQFSAGASGTIFEIFRQGDAGFDHDRTNITFTPTAAGDFSASTAGGGGRIDLAALDGSDGFRFEGRDYGDEAGSSVSGAGDINDDGFADLLIGAPDADHPENEDAGEAFVIFGGPNVGGDGRPVMDPNVFDGSTGFTIHGIDENDESGTSVSGAGDVNGDGFADLLIGAPRADTDDNERFDTGESYIVFGGASLSVLDAADGTMDGNINLSELDGTNGFVLNGIDSFDNSGFAVSSAGDINGDGFDDFIIGARRADFPEAYNAGESYVVFGGLGIGAGGSIDLVSLDGSKGFVLAGINAA